MSAIGGKTQARRAASAASLPAAAVWVAALAQLWVPAARAEDRSAESGTALEEIVVTAQKRSENIQSVPISISAVTERSLELLGASDNLGYFGTVPGLNFQSQGPTGDQHGNATLSLRGIAATSGADTVGFYINETPIHFLDPDLFDVARVEVLRGPQGTLYGASSMGGTLRVITNEPDVSQFGGKLDLTTSRTHHGATNVDGSAVFNIPLIADRLALRVVGFSRDDSGYIDNILHAPQSPPSSVVPQPIDVGANDVEKRVNTETLRGTRIALKGIVNDELNATATWMQQSLRIGGDPTYKVILDPTDPAFSIGTISPLVNDFTHGDLVTHDINPAPQEEKFSVADLTVRYNPGPFSVVSSTSYYDRSTAGVIDMTVVLPVVFGMTVPVSRNLDDLDSGHGFTEELRVNSTIGPVSWLLGGFYQKVYTQFRQSLIDQDFNNEVFGGAPVVPDGVFLAFLSRDEQSQTAVFADVTWHATSRLDLAAGIRQFKVDLTTNTVGDGLFNGGPTQTDSRAHNSGNTPRFLASYRFTEDIMAYATVSKGFRPGFGLDPVGSACDPVLEQLGLPLNRTQVDPDSLWNHEVGIKSQFFGRRLTLNAAAYDIDWNNIQQNLNLGTCGYSTTVNSGKARSRGFELEMAALPLRGLELNLGLSLTDAKLTDNAQEVGAVSGDPLLGVAKWHASGSATYTWPLRPKFDGYARADYQYTGPMQDGYDFSNPILQYVNRQPGYDVINLRTGVLHDDWEFAVFLQNATDSRPRLTAGVFISPDITVYTIRPRTVGINVKKSF
ncbi:MAG TPA: TonB-dependent receptor [Steroidobacteraceae bacterium]|nr:TonB-dependent receptor [Steroidobacteraceae bacterium]